VTLPSSSRALAAGWLRGVRGDRALWQAALAGAAATTDYAFAVLDRATLAPRAPYARIPAPSIRTVVAVLGDHDLLLAWLAPGPDPHHPIGHFAVWPH